MDMVKGGCLHVQKWLFDLYVSRNIPDDCASDTDFLLMMLFPSRPEKEVEYLRVSTELTNFG